ncbi:1-phosphofructokinase [Sporolactobacillus pectinivorans]|uniref:1-phosphofructokinase n=1 Tax=Sporolactobacillus pectinivorans TaxID=1591408 RepID=UPI000C257351|nr:1-phosphofructokinase [Sporolactobacillus pectinivorans]
MIITITLNPSVDMNYQLKALKINEVNRSGNPILTAGGKGLNVTRVIHQNREPVIATGFLGGLTGTFIRQQLDQQGVKHRFVPIRQSTRHCLALMHEGNQTEVLENGPEISPDEKSAFFQNYEKLLELGDVVTASGSIPRGLGTEFYRQLIELANKCGKKFILDSSGEALKTGIKAKPFLIKPNQYEIEALIGRTIDSEKELVEAIKELTAEGPENIVVSLGSKGALAFLNKTFYRVHAAKIEAVSAVGSGDSMIAGLALGTARGYSAEKTLALGSTFGTLNALESATGVINTERIDAFLKKVSVSRLEEKDYQVNR